MAANQSVNQRIKQVRQTLHLSQAKFAKETLVSSGLIAGIELGSRNVNNRIIKLICVAFNVNECWLKTGEGDMFKEYPNHLEELTFTAFKQLQPTYQDFIYNVIDQLLDIQNKNEKEDE